MVVGSRDGEGVNNNDRVDVDDGGFKQRGDDGG